MPQLSDLKIPTGNQPIDLLKTLLPILMGISNPDKSKLMLPGVVPQSTFPQAPAASPTPGQQAPQQTQGPSKVSAILNKILPLAIAGGVGALAGGGKGAYAGRGRGAADAIGGYLNQQNINKQLRINQQNADQDANMKVLERIKDIQKEKNTQRKQELDTFESAKDDLVKLIADGTPELAPMIAESIIDANGWKDQPQAQALRVIANQVAETPPKKPAPVAGTDVPFPAEVEAQKARIAAAGRQEIPGRDVPYSPEVFNQLSQLRELNNATTLKMIEVPGPDGKPVQTFVTPKEGNTYPTVSSDNKPPTTAERSSFKFWERGKDANNVLDEYEDIVTKFGFWGQIQLSKMPSWLQDETMKIYTQASRQFTEARLRKDSGAAVPESEIENDKKVYFVQPGDTPETIKRKKEARENTLNALARESGRAYTQSYGENPPPPPKVDKKPTVEKGDIVTWEGVSYRFEGGDPNNKTNYTEIGK